MQSVVDSILLTISLQLTISCPSGSFSPFLNPTRLGAERLIKSRRAGGIDSFSSQLWEILSIDCETVFVFIIAWGKRANKGGKTPSSSFSKREILILISTLLHEGIISLIWTSLRLPVSLTLLPFFMVEGWVGYSQVKT